MSAASPAGSDIAWTAALTAATTRPRTSRTDRRSSTSTARLSPLPMRSVRRYRTATGAFTEERSIGPPRRTSKAGRSFGPLLHTRLRARAEPLRSKPSSRRYAMAQAPPLTSAALGDGRQRSVKAPGRKGRSRSTRKEPGNDRHRHPPAGAHQRQPDQRQRSVDSQTAGSQRRERRLRRVHLPGHPCLR